MSWNILPGEVSRGEQVTYSITSAPQAAAYEWSYSSQNNDAVLRLSPIGDGTSAVVQYGNPASDAEVTLTVRSAGHPCGDATLSETFHVVQGCVEGTSVNLTPSGTINLTLGEPVSFSASSNATNNNNDLMYEWFVNNTSSGTASPVHTFTYTPTQPGTAVVAVRVTNDCTTAGRTLEAQAILQVKPNPANYTPDTSGNFKLTGKTCFDVAQSNFSNTDGGSQSQRPGDFLDGNRRWVEDKPWVYTFTAASNIAYSNLQFVTSDPGVLIKSETPNTQNNTCILVFDESVLTKAMGRDRTEALTVTVYALFRSGGEDKRVEITIKVQDYMCSCGAYVSSGVWKAFMCHNLGADETLNPFEPAKGLHGAKYKFGAKTAALTMEEDQTVSAFISGWQSKPYNAGNQWNSTANNPCPDGYRVPTMTEWENVTDASLNARSLPNGVTWLNNSNNYACGVYFGNNLFLPAAGYRNSDNGELNQRGISGYYWSSSVYNNGTGYRMSFILGTNFAITNMSSHSGYSIRCIAE
jgi:uncharacterized protein (TIGR02145 family)